MVVDVKELILQPFHEVVQRGREAVANAEAGGHEPGVHEPGVAKLMLKSARALEREGERALQRLQPLWDGRVAQYGNSFTEAMTDKEKQRTLEDLLYDLDDFVEIDTFDEDRFAEVQAASKAFALNLLETIKRLRIEPPEPAPPTGLPTPTSPEPAWSEIPKLSQPSRDRDSSKPPNCALPATPQEAARHCRRPSSPDILGAERQGVRLVSQPTSPGRLRPVTTPRTTSPRISAWVNEQTQATPWPLNDSVTESGPTARQVAPTDAFETGLMLANESTISVADRRSKRSKASCQIGLESTLYKLDSFCPGAQAFKNRGPYAATKATMEYGTNGSVARCVECEFRHNLAELELDVGRDSSGNWCKADVLYRLRFVYKSHLKVRAAHTVYYGCLFCAQQGYTVHEGDATVFTKEEQLFQHLARHPQPLPEVAGVTVLYGKVDKDNPLIEDYDLHFPNPPVPSPYPDETVLARLSTATTLKNHERRYGSRPLTDPDGNKDGVLQFLAGSRIVGIGFPEKWKGKWCTGWQEGVQGSFPANLVALEPPESAPEMSNSGLAATTRWTWDKRDFKDQNAGWLSFGSNETIFHISCKCGLDQEPLSTLSTKGRQGPAQDTGG
ncbi:hypothetical protein DL770_002329 [Monosporascus sp. CRB-9-2]|nr:hypothetical protein DL770_002329 [Monosporascus sp. CRB-9-2]